MQEWNREASIIDRHDAVTSMLRERMEYVVDTFNIRRAETDGADPAYLDAALILGIAVSIFDSACVEVPGFLPWFEHACRDKSGPFGGM